MDMNQVMKSLGENRLIMFDSIPRAGYEKYFKTPSELRVEHDPRAQASCIYSHMIAKAERVFDNMNNVRPLEVNGLRLWVFDDAGVVVRFKKMDRYGLSRSYQTQQQKDFDKQLPLPNISLPPVRVQVGYLLDELQTNYVRTQIAAPNGKRVLWCAAVHPVEDRISGEAIWYDVLEQRSLEAV